MTAAPYSQSHTVRRLECFAPSGADLRAMLLARLCAYVGFAVSVFCIWQ